MTQNPTETTAVATETADQLRQRLAELDAQQSQAREALDAANEQFGEAALGTDSEATARAADVVAQRQQDVQRLQAARAALETRLGAAARRDAYEDHDRRWDAYAEALEARHSAFERAEQAAKPFFEAVAAAVVASERAWELTPQKGDVLTPAGWVLVSHVFEGMARLNDEEIVTVRTALRDLANKSRIQGDAGLRLREFTRPDFTKPDQAAAA